MHGFRCIPVVGEMRTIVLPQRGESRVYQSGGSVALGTELRPGFGLVISARAEVLVELTIAGGPSTFLTLERGMNRIVSPEVHPSVLVTSTDLGTWWQEDLRALKKREGD